ncbi:MAG: 30S ribosomal protein S1 [Candidatus Dependentiae bacterium]|nr:30S ribosomal protein S1 [Candidatus Dependentiae bacterium]
MSKEFIRPDQFCNVKTARVEEEDFLELSEEQLKELSDLYTGLFEQFKVGKIVSGVVVTADSDGVLVDIGFKSRGLIPKFEFKDHEIKKFKAGDPIEVMLDELESPEGTVVLSYEKAKALKAWQTIITLFEEGKPVEGLVTHKVKGGLNVDIGVPAFLPGSQIDLQRITDFDNFVGQVITANILKINQKRGNVIISRRKYLGDIRVDSRKKILDKLNEGGVIQGMVKNITNYGVFIDIGGVDGLLHITDMTWGRISHPSELVKIGDTITVKVLSFDKDNQKIALGLKQLSENPWANIDEKLKVGDRIKGRVSSITDYGLFVEVAKDIEGLVHISEVSWTDRINNLNQRFKVGDTIDVVVVSLDKENRRMSLSIKQLENNPWETIDQAFKPEQKIKGKISNITDFGIFVQLVPGIDGLVHISDLSWTEHIDHPSDRYKISDEVEAVILSIDKDNKKVSLGVKQLDRDPWATVGQDYPIDSTIEGEVSKITNFGAFVKLPTGIEGLIHNTTLMEDQGKKAEAVLKVGQKSEFRVISVNKEERKLGLSLQLEKVKKPVVAPVVERPAKEKEKEVKVKREKEKPAVQAVQSPAQAAAPKTKSSLQVALESAMQKQEQDAKDAENK